MQRLKIIPKDKTYIDMTAVRDTPPRVRTKPGVADVKHEATTNAIKLEKDAADIKAENGLQKIKTEEQYQTNEHVPIPETPAAPQPTIISSDRASSSNGHDAVVEVGAQSPPGTAYFGSPKLRNKSKTLDPPPRREPRQIPIALSQRSGLEQDAATGDAEIARTDAAATLPSAGAANPTLASSTSRDTKRKALQDDLEDIKLEQRKRRIERELAELEDDK